MARRRAADRMPASLLAELVEQSGLPSRTFATVMGCSHTTLWNCLNSNRGWVTEERLNAARFALLKLGKPVEVPPPVLPRHLAHHKPYRRKTP